MKRVLVISYYWPPSGGSGVQRWVKMCKYLADYGWQPVVYTPENPAVTSKDESLAGDIPWSVEVIRKPIVEPGQFASKTTSAQVTPINAQKKTLKQKIAMWIRGNCFIPDPRVVWVLPSVLYLQEYLKGHPVDMIVSTGPPHSMHLIARGLARRTSIPWIADFRDPWTRMFYFKHLSLTKYAERRHLRMEKSVLDEADRVVAVSPLVQEDFKTMTSTPVELVTNGFDEDDFVSPDSYVTASGKGLDPRRFSLVHAGLFASDGNPTVLWHVLGSMLETVPGFKEDFSLVLCGKTDAQITASIKEAGLGENFEDKGYLEHSAVVEVMKSAAVLLLPLRKEPEYKATLPGKLFEYLAARRPIFGIGQTDGAMAAVVDENGAGEVFGWDDEAAMRAAMERLYAAFKAGELADNKADLSRYTRRSLAARYAALMDEVADRNDTLI